MLPDTPFKKRYIAAVFFLLGFAILPLYHPQLLASSTPRLSTTKKSHEGHAHHSFRSGASNTTVTLPLPGSLSMSALLEELESRALDPGHLERLQALLLGKGIQAQPPPPIMPVSRSGDSSNATQAEAPPPLTSPPAAAALPPSPPRLPPQQLPSPEKGEEYLLPSTVSCTLSPDGGDYCEYTNVCMDLPDPGLPNGGGEPVLYLLTHAPSEAWLSTPASTSPPPPPLATHYAEMRSRWPGWSLERLSSSGLSSGFTFDFEDVLEGYAGMMPRSRPMSSRFSTATAPLSAATTGWETAAAAAAARGGGGSGKGGSGSSSSRGGEGAFAEGNVVWVDDFWVASNMLGGHLWGFMASVASPLMSTHFSNVSGRAHLPPLSTLVIPGAQGNTHSNAHNAWVWGQPWPSSVHASTDKGKPAGWAWAFGCLHSLLSWLGGGVPPFLGSGRPAEFSPGLSPDLWGAWTARDKRVRGFPWGMDEGSVAHPGAALADVMGSWQARWEAGGVGGAAGGGSGGDAAAAAAAAGGGGEIRRPKFTGETELNGRVREALKVCRAEALGGEGRRGSYPTTDICSSGGDGFAFDPNDKAQGEGVVSLKVALWCAAHVLCDTYTPPPSSSSSSASSAQDGAGGSSNSSSSSSSSGSSSDGAIGRGLEESQTLPPFPTELLFSSPSVPNNVHKSGSKKSDSSTGNGGGSIGTRMVFTSRDMPPHMTTVAAFSWAVELAGELLGEDPVGVWEGALFGTTTTTPTTSSTTTTTTTTTLNGGGRPEEAILDPWLSADADAPLMTLASTPPLAHFAQWLEHRPLRLCGRRVVGVGNKETLVSGTAEGNFYREWSVWVKRKLGEEAKAAAAAAAAAAAGAGAGAAPAPAALPTPQQEVTFLGPALIGLDGEREYPTEPEPGPPPRGKGGVVRVLVIDRGQSDNGVTVVGPYGRRFWNLDEMLGVLDKYGVPYTLVDDSGLGSLSFEQHVALYAGAKLLITAHSAGEANALFMPPRSTIIEVYGAGMWCPIYLRALTAGGHHVLPIYSRLVSPTQDYAYSYGREQYAAMLDKFRVCERLGSVTGSQDADCWHEARGVPVYTPIHEFEAVLLTALDAVGLPQSHKGAAYHELEGYLSEAEWEADPPKLFHQDKDFYKKRRKGVC